jgi:hypothetical protein
MGSSTKSLETRDEVAYRHPAQWSDTAGEIAFAAMRPTSDTNGSVQEPPLQDETITRIADELPVFPEGVTVPEHDTVRFSSMVIRDPMAGDLSPYQREKTAESVRTIAKEYDNVYFQNTNPEALSRLEDLRMVTTEIFSRLNQLGLLPVEIDSEKVSEIFNVPITKFSPSEKLYSDMQDLMAFANSNSPHSMIGTKKEIDSLIESPETFVHEMVHAVLQDYSTNLPPSLMEATVQHIAERGTRMFLEDPENRQGEPPELSLAPNSGLAKYHARKRFKNRAMHAGEESSAYNWERLVMYQLAPIEDFVAALCDAEKIQDLKNKINSTGFGEKLGLTAGEDVMTALQEMIDGNREVLGFDTQGKQIPSLMRTNVVNILLLEARGKGEKAKRYRKQLERELAAIPEARGV